MGRTTGRGRRLVVGAAVLVAVGLGACGGSDDTTTAATTTTVGKAETTTTKKDKDAVTTTAGSAATADLWARTAQEHRGKDGTKVEFDCPAGGTIKSIWGTETYTDDSSVCTAAVHVGLITLAKGGTVTVEIQPGEATYEAGEANGVTSQYYGSYQGSYTFPDAPPGSGEFAAPAASWTQTVTGLQVGDTRTLECSAGGPIASVWGTGTYTSDSSICTAAVLEGRITVADGGTVAVEVVAGQDVYTGSAANGVTSQDYAAYGLSFRFADDQPSG